MNTRITLNVHIFKTASPIIDVIANTCSRRVAPPTSPCFNFVPTTVHKICIKMSAEGLEIRPSSHTKLGERP